MQSDERRRQKRTLLADLPYFVCDARPHHRFRHSASVYTQQKRNDVQSHCIDCGLRHVSRQHIPAARQLVAHSLASVLSCTADTHKQTIALSWYEVIELIGYSLAFLAGLGKHKELCCRSDAVSYGIRQAEGGSESRTVPRCMPASNVDPRQQVLELDKCTPVPCQEDQPNGKSSGRYYGQGAKCSHPSTCTLSITGASCTAWRRTRAWTLLPMRTSGLVAEDPRLRITVYLSTKYCAPPSSTIRPRPAPTTRAVRE